MQLLPFRILSGKALKVASAAAITLTSLTLTSCFDDKYDLSDIDTNVRVSVNDLTLPINIDEIQLKTIIDLDDDGIVKEIDDEYVILRTGSFESSALNIDPISIEGPTSRPSVTTFVPEIPMPAPRRAASQELFFNIDRKEASDIHYSYDGVSKDIVAIDYLGATWTIDYDVTLSTDDNSATSFNLHDFVFQLPKGLAGQPSIGSYNSATGLLTIQDMTVPNGRLKFHMNITGVDAHKAGVIFNTDTHHLEITDQTGVIDGKIGINLNDVISGTGPKTITVTTALTLSRIDISTFTGSIKYDIDDINIAPVELNDLPDVLAQKGTDIKISNPQIYLSVANPFTEYNVHATTGFALDAIRADQAPVHSAIDNGTFTITSAAHSYYCLSPVRPDKYYEGYASATHIPFRSLSTALAGDGLPSKIEINLDPTLVPVQTVNSFRLGSYSPIKGDYVFYAPLALGAGSVIEYTDTEDGWSDDDLDKLTITKVNVDALLTTNLPFDITLTGYPVDKKGNQINDVTIEGAVVKANSNNQPITIYITGTVKELDGIRFSAKAVSEADAQSLSPSQFISLKSIHATVSGYYDDEL